jgi:endonuclease/exonuclease/phosphatase family metal-dependent hydrolase
MHAFALLEVMIVAAVVAILTSIALPAYNAPTGLSQSVASVPLKLATWNLEWLIAPAVFKPLKQTCAPRDEHSNGLDRRLPCDVAYKLERSTRDFKTLERYAQQLNADVIALQEVDGPAAARLVFPTYQFCFTSRPHLQNNGFAVRPGLSYQCGPDFRPLSLNDHLRRGAELILFPGEPREIHLLSVHLKSGCSTGLLNGPEKTCAELARQVPALEMWIDARAREGKRFAVLGDFNRDLLHDQGPALAPNGTRLHLWPEIDDGNPPEADLVNAAEGTDFRNCVPGQGYSTYIDHIVLSRSLGLRRVPNSFQRVTYTPLDMRRTKLSDHCPIAVSIRAD